MHPTVPFSNIPGYVCFCIVFISLCSGFNEVFFADLPHTLSQVAEFVATHFSDARIVIAETKDTLTQALSTFICNRQMLTALGKPILLFPTKMYIFPLQDLTILIYQRKCQAILSWG